MVSEISILSMPGSWVEHYWVKNADKVFSELAKQSLSFFSLMRKIAYFLSVMLETLQPIKWFPKFWYSFRNINVTVSTKTILAGFPHPSSLLIREFCLTFFFTQSLRSTRRFISFSWKVCPFASFFCGQACQSASLRAFACDATGKPERQWRRMNRSW